MATDILPRGVPECTPAPVVLQDGTKVKLPAQVLMYRDRRVFTTKQVAEGFGCPQNNITNNFKRNPDRFTPGKAFHLLEGDELKAFSLRIAESDVQISPMTRRLYLWTEEGVFNHAKLVNTDRAWDMYRMLVRTYFMARDGGLVTPEQVAKLVDARVAEALQAQQRRLDELEAKVTTVVEPTHFAMAGHERRYGVRLTDAERKLFIRNAKRRSKALGLTIGSVSDRRWGVVNTYAVEAVAPDFAQVLAADALFAKADELAAEARRHPAKAGKGVRS